jgi:hypothetical protein
MLLKKRERPLNVKVRILSYDDNSVTKPKFGAVKDHAHGYKFHLNHCFILRNFQLW